MSIEETGGISRRDALLAMALVPVAASLGVEPAELESAMRAAEQAQQQQQQPNPATYKPKFFSAHEMRTVRVLADLVIPRDERSGSASDAGVPEFMDFMMIDRPAMQLTMRGGLRWLDNESNRRYAQRFVALAQAQQHAILDDIAYPGRARPEFSHGVAFFTFFRDLTAGGFWSSRMGVRDIGYIGNVYNQWDGCPPAAMERLGVRPDMMNTRVPIQRS